ncbi:phosphodiester glycosidase family protein [Mammaliicoccus sciuri]|uniref:phosphodiester glycosidase family protein n=1 Tax=Mammaliicoccus sciuri TaxID=1296 RepID=UPI0016269B68|nr:phosphodiester glycosidase family protein [Mammaliicoccus sciuri]
MEQTRLIKYLDDIFNEHFVGQNEKNYTEIEQALNDLKSKIAEHEKLNGNTVHDAEQIKIFNSTLEDVARLMKAQIENLVVGANGNGNIEVKDAHVDMDGKRHNTLQSRLQADLSAISNMAKGSKTLADKHEKEIQKTAFYDEITSVKGRKHETSYKLIIIPHKDKEGNLIKLKRGIVGDDKSHPEHITPREFAQLSGASFVANASTGSGSRLMLHGQQIYEGKILDSVKDYEPLKDRWTMTIGENNELYSYPQAVSASEIKKKGINNTVSGFGPLILDGKVAYQKGMYSVNSEESHPRQVIGQLPNNDIFFFTCDGRIETGQLYHKGMTLLEVIDTVQDHFGKGDGKIKFLYNLDGGGSSASILHGQMLNKLVDSNHKAERPVLDFLYVAKEKVQPRDNDIHRIMNMIGDLRYDNQFIFGMLQHYNHIESKELNLINGNTGYAGIVMRDDKRKPMSKLYLDKRIAFYRYDKKKSIFIVDDRGLHVDGKMMAKKHSAPGRVRNCNNIRYGGDYHVLSDATNAPYPNQSSAIVTHWNIGSIDSTKASSAIQRATPFARSASVKEKRRTYTKKDGWSDWFEV